MRGTSYCADASHVGCFEHYANLRRHDASFAAYHKAEEWLATYDIFSGAMRNNGDYSLMTYLSYPLVAFYPLFQERGGSRVERPKADWEVLTYVLHP
jgi:chromosome transmission fidelity protein 18